MRYFIRCSALGKIVNILIKNIERRYNSYWQAIIGFNIHTYLISQFLEKKRKREREKERKTHTQKSCVGTALLLL